MAHVRRRLAAFGSPGAITAMTSVLLIVATILTGIVTARLLSVSDRGTYSALLAVASVLSMVATAGSADALILAPQRGVGPRTTTTLVWSLSLSLGVLGAVPAFFYAALTAEPPAVVIWMTLILPVVSALGPLCNYWLLANGFIRKSAVLRLAPVTVQILGLVAVMLLGVTDLSSVYATSFVGSVAAGIIGVRFTRPWKRFTLHWNKTDTRTFRSIVLGAGASHLVRVIGSRLDLILVAGLLGVRAAGLYAVAASLTTAGLSLTSNLAPLLLTKSKEASWRFTSIGSALSLTIAAAVALVGPPLIPLVYGDAYADASALVPFLALAMFSAFAFDTLTRIFQQDRREIGGMWASLGAFAAQIVAIVTLSSHFGLIGAALGNVVGCLIGILILTALNRRHRGGPLVSRLSPIAGFVVFFRIARGE